jgi:hypothetical protein
MNHQHQHQQHHKHLDLQEMQQVLDLQGMLPHLDNNEFQEFVVKVQEKEIRKNGLSFQIRLIVRFAVDPHVRELP